LATYRNAVLIYNPNAGGLIRNRAGRVWRALEILSGNGHQVTPRPTTHAGHATELAAEAVAAGADLILVAGGDGTINEAMNGMIGSDVPLAPLPAGTANVLCMEVGFGSGMRGVARRLDSLQPVRVSTGLITAAGASSRHFLLMAGFGLDADVVSRVRPDIKKRLGKLAYWLAGFTQVGRRLPQMLVRAEGRELRTGFALASRVRNYGGDIEIARTASLLSDDFELVVFEGETTLPYVKYFTGVVTGTLAGMSGVTVLRTRSVELAPVNGSQVLTQIDGEEAGSIPARIEIVPSAISLLLPESLPSRYKRP
jgi:diacylglycerol kinase (ATP)